MDSQSPCEPGSLNLPGRSGEGRTHAALNSVAGPHLRPFGILSCLYGSEHRTISTRHNSRKKQIKVVTIQSWGAPTSFRRVDGALHSPKKGTAGLLKNPL